MGIFFTSCEEETPQVFEGYLMKDFKTEIPASGVKVEFVLMNESRVKEVIDFTYTNGDGFYQMNSNWKLLTGLDDWYQLRFLVAATEEFIGAVPVSEYAKSDIPSARDTFALPYPVMVYPRLDEAGSGQIVKISIKQSEFLPKPNGNPLHILTPPFIEGEYFDPYLCTMSIWQQNSLRLYHRDVANIKYAHTAYDHLGRGELESHGRNNPYDTLVLRILR